MAIIGINYDGGNYYDDDDKLVENPINYRNVYLYLSSDEEHIFDTGNFIKDWYNASKKFLSSHESELRLGKSSSVDHFIGDGAPYDSAYIVFKNDDDIVGELSYDKQDSEKGWEMFVPKGTTPTWEELKKMCKTE